jgi:hypothetical protein
MAEMTQIEGFVDAAKAGKFLGLSAFHVRRLAQSGRIPAHNYGAGKKAYWRFKLSELNVPISSKAPPVSRNQD